MKEARLNPPKSILVPVDFSPTSLAAFKYAAQLAQAVSGKLTALYVVDDPALISRNTAEEFRQEAILMATERLREEIAELRDGQEVDLCVKCGPPAETIVREAEARKVDLIVIGTLGEGGWSRLLLGSAADRVIRYALCPVLAVKTHSPALGE